MTLRVSGKNLDIGESLRTHVGTRIDCVVAKHSARLTNGHVTIEREGSGFRTDCTLHLGSGAILQVEAEAQDAYASFNMAVDRIENRLRRHMSRLKDRNGANIATRDEPDEPMRVSAQGAPVDTTDDDDACPIVIAESFDGLKEMSVSGAVKELDITNANVVIFRHAGDGRPNIVYRRTDGNIGWIDPPHPLKA
jgi:ribosomal subunit interface protein